jgi:hypothetical protein
VEDFMTDANDKDGTLSQDVVAEIRKQAIGEVSKWVIIGFIALIGLAASGWWFYLQQKLDEYIATHAAGVPSAAVMAFDQPNGCPKGWTAFEQAAGRAVIGAATAQQASASGGTPHAYRASGGQETHKLTEAELPPLKFSFTVNAAENNSAGDRVKAGGPDQFVVMRTPTPINLTTNGKADAFSTMPPYVALFYCKKD